MSTNLEKSKLNKIPIYVVNFKISTHLLASFVETDQKQQQYWGIVFPTLVYAFEHAKKLNHYLGKILKVKLPGTQVLQKAGIASTNLNCDGQVMSAEWTTPASQKGSFTAS